MAIEISHSEPNRGNEPAKNIEVNKHWLRNDSLLLGMSVGSFLVYPNVISAALILASSGKAIFDFNRFAQ